MGGQDEIGYFAPAANGRLQYHSLLNLLPAKDRSFGDVWDIVSFKGNTYFRSPTKILKFTDRTAVVFNAPGEWAFLGLCNNHLYAQDYKAGLLQFQNEVWAPISATNSLPPGDAVTGIIPINNDSALITTLKNGLYCLTGNKIVIQESVNNTLFKKDRIYAVTAVNKDWVALATNNNGIYITDLKGNIIQSFSRTEDLQNNNVRSVFPMGSIIYGWVWIMGLT